ncbi:MAG: DUF5684 domain-containing protein [Eubacteriales bacterium]|nr:DUF5684 domain-containing protein [Eubacteriales bacterium]
MAGVLVSMFFSMMVFSFFILVVIACCLGRMRIFQKAGVEAWKAFIPFYRDYELCRITMGKGWYFLLGLIPVLYPVMKVLYAIEICLCFGQEMLFGVAYFFFPWLCELIVGFGKAEYLGSQDLDRQLRNLFSAPKGPKDKGAQTYNGAGTDTYEDTQVHVQYKDVDGNGE